MKVLWSIARLFNQHANRISLACCIQRNRHMDKIAEKSDSSTAAGGRMSVGLMPSIGVQ